MQYLLVLLSISFEENKFIEPVNTLIKEDSILYGLDETLALGVTNLYGSIGLQIMAISIK